VSLTNNFWKKLLSAIGLAILFFGCSEQHQESTMYSQIIGDWEEVYNRDNDSPPPFGTSTNGYSFFTDKTVDLKAGIYKQIKGTENKMRFLGTKTRFRIEGDSLSIFNLSDSSWWSRKILSITKDYFVLRLDKGKKQKFTRVDYTVDTLHSFDKIILSSSGCYGTCPILDVIIYSNGNVVFLGERYTTETGFFTATISREQFENLQNNFRKANLKNIETNFSVAWSDDERISTTFVSGDKIYKSIKDYGEAGPDELVWAYVPLRNLYQTLELHRLSKEEFPFYLDLHYFRFENGNQICDLSQSESFLLWDYLRQGKRTTMPVKNRLELNFNRNYTWSPLPGEFEGDLYNEKQENKVIKIETDGQFYKFNLSGQQPITIDIGFNFFDNNFNQEDFREKTQYD